MYLGDLLVSSSHLKAGGSASDFEQRIVAGQNIAYYINFGLNSGSDPFGIIAGATPTALGPPVDDPPKPKSSLIRLVCAVASGVSASDRTKTRRRNMDARILRTRCDRRASTYYPKTRSR